MIEIISAFAHEGGSSAVNGRIYIFYALHHFRRAPVIDTTPRHVVMSPAMTKLT
jgi:hypothetical protein